MKREYEARRDYLYGELTRMGFSFPKPEGAFYIFAPLGKELTARILSRGVVIVPGEAFGCNAPEYARMSYATSRDNLHHAVDRIRKATEG